jgi:hypothetical protein
MKSGPFVLTSGITRINQYQFFPRSVPVIGGLIDGITGQLPQSVLVWWEQGVVTVIYEHRVRLKENDTKYLI